MVDGKTAKLAFENLLNGLRVDQVREALKLSEKEVGDAWNFMASKIRSYWFERGRPILPLDTPAAAAPNRIAILITLARINPDKEPRFSRVYSEVLDGSPVAGGTMGRAEAMIFEVRSRGLANARRR